MSKNINSICNKDILDIIKPDDALQILRQLAKQSNEIREKIQKLAMEILSDVVDEWKKGNPNANDVEEIERLIKGN